MKTVQLAGGCGMFFVLASLVVQIVTGTPQAATARIEGIVLAVGSDQPIAGAQVRLGPQVAFWGNLGFGPVQPATTDAQGKFSFTELDANTYGISVIAEGYAPQEYGARVGAQPTTQAPKPIPLKAGSAVRDIVIRMTPTGAVSGKVVANGQPVKQIEVRLVLPMYNAAGRRFGFSAGVTLTDDRGEYRIWGVSPGKYYLIAGPPFSDTLRNLTAQMEQAVVAAGQRYPTTFYPSTTDMDKASLVEVRAGGDVRDLNLTVFPQEFYRIRGQVLDSRTNQPFKDQTEIFWYRRDEPYGPSGMGSRNNSRVSADGTFVIANLIPGKYSLQVRVRPAGLDSVMAAAMRPVAQAAIKTEIVASDVNLTLRLQPAVDIRGHITVDGKPPADQPGFDRMVVVTEGLILGSIAMISPARSDTPANDGSFTIQRVAPAAYRVAVGGLPPESYVKSATLGKTDVLNEALEISESTSEVLEIEIGSKPGRVEGTVNDATGKPVDNIRVVLIPSNAARIDLYRVVNTNKDGQFAISGVAPGDYRLYSWESLDGYMYFDPAFVSMFTDRATAIRATESGTTTAALTVIPSN